jgi:hypothetical protein
MKIIGVVLLVILIIGGFWAAAYFFKVPGHDFVVGPTQSLFGISSNSESPKPMSVDLEGPAHTAGPAKPAQTPASGANSAQPPEGTKPDAQSNPLTTPPSESKTESGNPLSISMLNPFSGGREKSQTSSGEQSGSPTDILQACMDKLHERDIIGAEQYVSENGRRFVLGNTTGIHKVLLKYVMDAHMYDEIGYDKAEINGQTTWVPVYSRLGGGRKMVTVFIIMANRGDGWKLDDLYDPKH